MFRNAPPEVFQQQSPALPPPQDYYMKSEPVISSHEDLTTSSDVSFRLADFGTGQIYTLRRDFTFVLCY